MTDQNIPRRKWPIGLCLAAAVLLGLAMGQIGSSAAGQARVSPGLEPYTPTRLEWFALELQSHYGHPQNDKGVSVRFLPREPDTVLIQIEHLPQAGIDVLLNDQVERTRKAASDRGYTWLKVEPTAVPQQLKP